MLSPGPAAAGLRRGGDQRSSGGGRGEKAEERVEIKMEQRVDLVWRLGSSPAPHPPAFRLGGMATKSYGDC